MVTSPNWMAPFHIARATAGPQYDQRAGRSEIAEGPAPHHTRAGNRSASRALVRPSTEDDERVDVDPAVAAQPDVDRVRAEGRECPGVHHHAALAGARLEADRRA